MPIMLSEVCIPTLNAGRLEGTRTMSKSYQDPKTGKTKWSVSDRKVADMFLSIVKVGDLIKTTDVEPIKVRLVTDGENLMDKTIAPDYFTIRGENKGETTVYDVTASKLKVVQDAHSKNVHKYVVVSGHTRLETLLKYQAIKGQFQDVELYAEIITPDAEAALTANRRFVTVDVTLWDKCRAAYQEVFFRNKREIDLYQPTTDGRGGIFSSKGDASGSYAACLIAREEGWSFEELFAEMAKSGHIPDQKFRMGLSKHMNLDNQSLKKAMEDDALRAKAVAYIRTKPVVTDTSNSKGKDVIGLKRKAGTTSHTLVTLVNAAVAKNDLTELWAYLDALDKVVNSAKLKAVVA